MGVEDREETHLDPEGAPKAGVPSLLEKAWLQLPDGREIVWVVSGQSWSTLREPSLECREWQAGIAGQKPLGQVAI